ncbi:small ubiquitin-related modifier 2-like isoform X2 [Epinephelus moara]|uniref:small ubiquitin-related modifier 2-like isoform X2 n=1 Tax=Epinephelus moara TaxID=300413 RepID=UPI00214E33E2|nr:small ubiquitin-related modifier 2-like isoform X2 [Epinephelus moara]
MADEKPKETVKTESNEHINLKVVGQDRSVIQFKIKRHTQLSKLMKAYCERQLEMEDDDAIDVFQQQTGGLV